MLLPFISYSLYVTETTVTNQNYIHEEIEIRLNSGNACHHSLQDLLSPHVLCKKVNIKINRTIILTFVLYGCETWSLPGREEHKLKVFGEEVVGEWGKLYNEDLSSLPNILG
jgi:hypothetical protein